MYNLWKSLPLENTVQGLSQ